jgi:hypothetical protein
VVSVFESPTKAREAIVALERAGVDGSKISYLALDRPDAEHPIADAEVDAGELRQIGRSTAKGIALGCVVGAVFAIAFMLISGVAPEEGWASVGVALGGAAAGGIVGGIWGAFSNMAEGPAWDGTFVALTDGVAIVGVHTNERRGLERAIAVLPPESHLFDRDGNDVTQAPRPARP